MFLCSQCCLPVPSHLNQVVCQSSHAREVRDVAEKLRLLGETNFDAVQQLSDGADPLLLARGRAVWSRVQLLQGFIQSQLAALQTLLVVLQLQQGVLGGRSGHTQTCLIYFKNYPFAQQKYKAAVRQPNIYKILRIVEGKKTKTTSQTVSVWLKEKLFGSFPTCSSISCAGRSGAELTNSRDLLLLP